MLKKIPETLRYVLYTLIFIIVLFTTLVIGSEMYHNSESELETSTNSSSTLSTEEAIEQHKNARYGDAEEKECGWCGGVGTVGYAGASEAQVRRTGMGAGNKCTSCKSTGKIKTWAKE